MGIGLLWPWKCLIGLPSHQKVAVGANKDQCNEYGNNGYILLPSRLMLAEALDEGPEFWPHQCQHCIRIRVCSKVVHKAQLMTKYQREKIDVLCKATH